MTTQLNFLSRLGFEATQTSLTLTRLDDDTAVQALSLIAANEYSRKWFIGDFFAQFARDAYMREDSRRYEQMLDLASKTFLEPSKIHECRKVSEFYPADKRFGPPLTYNHHLAAYRGTESLDEAVTWLGEAHRQSMDLTMFRLWIRDQKEPPLTGVDEAENAPLNRYLWLDDAERKARSAVREANNLKPREAKAILDSAHTLVEWIDLLRGVAGREVPQ